MTKPITHRPLKTPGRKPTVPPADAPERIRALAADGRGMIAIAHEMGVGKDAFAGWLERNPALQDAIDLGREDKRFALYQLLLTAANKGNVTAALAILNSEHGWRDGQSDTGNRVNVTIALPGAMTLAQFNSIGKETTNG
jgi:hypothetical protein